MRLSIDFGYSSIGWSLLGLNQERIPDRIISLGSMIFDNGRNRHGKPNAVERGGYRQARRQRHRRGRRKDKLLRSLVRHGLLPKDKNERLSLKSLDPYDLRERAAHPDKLLSRHEFGRLLIHLSQRRGFKSNRKAATEDDGMLRAAVAALEADFAQSGCMTLGQYLARRLREEGTARLRPQPKQHGSKVHYDLFIPRELVHKEFDYVWDRHAEHLGLTDDQKEEIGHCIFWQRPLKPVQPGRCSCDPEEPRAPNAHLLVQRYRILAELNNLCLLEPEGRRHLDAEERDILFRKLLSVNGLPFKQMRKLLKVDVLFNLESESRKGLKGCQVSSKLAHKDRFGAQWRKYTLADQMKIIERLLNEEDEDSLIAWLQAEMKVSEQQARAISASPLPSGYGSFSLKALEKIVPLMETQTVLDPESGVERYLRPDEAIKRAGYEPGTAKRSRNGLSRLPYYGQLLSHRTGTGSGDPQDEPEVRYGKIANPSVHIGLNQIRKLVNDIIERYGRPAEIVVELSRDPHKGPMTRDEIKQSQKKNRARNEEISKRLLRANIQPNPLNIKRYKLWEELNRDDESGRLCVYTGVRITFQMAMSGQTQIDHIIPRSRSLDNSLSNLLLCTARANRVKGNRTPFETWGHTDEWDAVASRARSLPVSKQSRILTISAEEAMIDDHLPERMLNDTRYVARVAREYLSHLCRNEDDIWCTNGNLTAMLRREWKLDGILGDGRKNRNDHRHHAIDALVIGLTDRHMIQRAAHAAERDEQAGLQRVFRGTPEPWEGFYEEVEKAVSGIVVYHKPDHGIGGALTKATNYGHARIVEEGREGELLVRQPLDRLTLPQIKDVKDAAIRERLLASEAHVLAGKDVPSKPNEKAARVIEHFKAANPQYAHVRRVQVYVRAANAVAVGPAESRRTVIPGGNHRIELWEARTGEREVYCISLMEAARGEAVVPHRPRGKIIPHRKLLTLHKNDLFLYRAKDGKERVMRLVRIKASGDRIEAIEHHEAGNLGDRVKHGDLKWSLILFSDIAKGAVQKVRMRPSGMLEAA